MTTCVFNDGGVEKPLQEGKGRPVGRDDDLCVLESMSQRQQALWRALRCVFEGYRFDMN